MCAPVLDSSDTATVYLQVCICRAACQGTSTAASIKRTGRDGSSAHTGELNSPLDPGAIVVISGKDDHSAVLSARCTIM